MLEQKRRKKKKREKTPHTPQFVRHTILPWGPTVLSPLLTDVAAEIEHRGS